MVSLQGSTVYCRISLAVVIGTVVMAADTRAQDAPGAIQNPPTARVERVAPPPMVAAAGEAAPPSGEARLTLRIGYTETTLRNPGTKQLDKVKLRSYTSEGAASGGDSPFIAPTIEVFPGDTVRITLKNELPPEPDCDKEDVNEPHCFNTTNLHGHGLAVSPSGNSDNVLISIRPQVEFQYEYNIPADHPAGTFWYHPHRHGSTALQVGSGMAGALIVRGRRRPTPTTTGDIDTLLRDAMGDPGPDRLLVFQQIPYACRTTNDAIKTNEADGTWLCESGDVGTVEKYDVFGKWKASGRYTMINGRTVEPLAQKAKQGRLERWRFIHAGVSDTLKVSFRKRLPGSRSFEGLRAGDQEAWIDANCDMTSSAQSPLPQYEIATDGLTREQIAVKRVNWLQPGYRSDVLVIFPTPGDYCVIDEAAPAAASVNGEGAGRQLLTLVTVDPVGHTPVTDIDRELKGQIRAAANRYMPAGVRERVMADIETFRLGAFAAHTSIANSTPSKTQHLWFGFGPTGVGESDTTIRAYDPERIDRQLTLGATEDWHLRSKASGHPFHIHVNPFEVLSIVQTDGGADLTQDPESEYFGLKGTWKDTLFVQQNATLVVRTQYRRYIGDFVLHCHILTHEDTGMMQNVRIALPNGQGGQEPASHDAMKHKHTETSDRRP